MQRKPEKKLNAAHAGNWMFRIMADNGANKLVHRPNAATVERLLEIAEWPEILRLLRNLHNEKWKPGASYGSFVEVANWRLNGRTQQEAADDKRNRRERSKTAATRAAV